MRRLRAGILSALVIGMIAAAPAGSGPLRDAVSSTNPDGTPVAADLDGNRLFDDLEAQLAGKSGGMRVGVIVTLRDAATRERVAGLMQQIGGFAVSRRLSIVPAFAAEMTKSQVEAVARLPQVAHVEENSRVHATNAAGELAFGVTKARLDSGLDGNADGNAGAYSKNDLVAAVIDTGIDQNHVDLDGGKVIGWKDLVADQPAPYDDNGHGTHVSATIAGDGDGLADHSERGVAPGAALVGVKVLDMTGYGEDATVVAALEWVVQNKDTYGIEAINLSLGGTGCSDGTDAASVAVNNAVAAGLVVAVAAGNAGPGTCTISSPGAAASAITVGAMSDLAAKGFGLAKFSSRGPTVDGRIKPDVSAPGVDVVSAKANTASGYITFSGTSMATPFTVGVALLMLDLNSSLSPQQLKTYLMQTAVDWGRGGNNSVAGSTGTDSEYGAGRLDAYAALRAAGASINAPPAAPAHVRYEGSLPYNGASVDYKIAVTDTSFPFAATMIIPSIRSGSSSLTDFNLKLYDPSGVQIATGATRKRQDELGVSLTRTGTYTLRVVSVTGSGAFFVDVSAGTAPPAPPTPDTTRPTVTSVSPGDGATGVAGTTPVSVTFSEAMDTASAQASFSLVNSSTLATIAGGFAWSGNTMTFTPSAPLAGGISYAARVAGGVAKDVAGNALAADRTWSFTTAVVTLTTAFPTSTGIFAGTVRSGGAANLRAKDGSFFEITASTVSYQTQWYGEFTAVAAVPTNLKVTYAGKNSVTCTQTIALYRWASGAWTQLDSRAVGSTVVEVANLAAPGSVADYVSGGALRVRVRCVPPWPQAFYTSGDLLQISYG